MTGEKTEQAAQGRRDSRELLLEALYGCLVEEGHAACSVKRIAERAGVNHGLVHHYFGSKEGMFSVLMERESARIKSGLTPGMDPNAAKDYVMRQAVKNPGHQRFLVEMVALSAQMPRLAQTMREVFATRRQMIDQMFGLNNPRLAALVFAALMGLTLQARLDERLEVDEILRELVPLMIRR